MRNLHSHQVARRWQAACILVAFVIVLVPRGAVAQSGPCTSAPALSWLDFWIGEWDVSVQGGHAGQNRIYKILDGCAVVEEWTGAGGRAGRSLFYFVAARDTWKQVWVTDSALARGGVKEKALVDRLPSGAVVFQGDIPISGGGSYPDRTTLTPLSPDSVRQHIEISADGGATWQTVFDGLYIRRR